MSPPVCSFSPATYVDAGSATKLVADHELSGVVEVNTTFGVWLMKFAKGCMSDVGQWCTQNS